MISKSDYEQALNAYGKLRRQPWRRRSGNGSRDHDKERLCNAADRLCRGPGQLRTQKLALLKAQLEYRWSVDGLASVS